MNKLEIQGQGFPVTKQTFEFMQQAYTTAIQHLSKMFGDNLILYGCDLVGSNRTAGAVVINGELLPFEASPHNAKIAIVETVENATYQSGVSLPAYKTRVAKCSSTGTVNLADLKRIDQKTAATAWQAVTYLAGYQTPGTYQLQARVDESGRGLVCGPFHIMKQRQNQTSHAIAQMPFTPCVRQTVQIMPYIYSKTDAGITSTGDSYKGGATSPVESYLFPFPVFGYVDTDGKLYLENSVGGSGFIVDLFGWVN